MTTDNKGENHHPRYRGILTTGDRKYLVNDHDLENQSSNDRDRRYRIRNRIEAAIIDMGFLNQYLPDKDQAKLFRNIFDEQPDVIAETLIFLYTGLKKVDNTNYGRDTLREELQDVLAHVIERGELQEGNLSDPSVSIEIKDEQPDFDQIRKKLLNGDGAWRELNYLIYHGEDIPLLEAIADGEEEIEIPTPYNPRPFFIGPKKAEDLLQERLEGPDRTV